MQAGGHPLNYVASEAPYPEGVALVAKADSDIQTVKDLKVKNWSYKRRQPTLFIACCIRKSGYFTG